MWYLFQLVIACYIINLFSEIPHEASPLHVAIFAMLCAYACTWILSKAVDLFRLLFALCSRGGRTARQYANKILLVYIR